MNSHKTLYKGPGQPSARPPGPFPPRDVRAPLRVCVPTVRVRVSVSVPAPVCRGGARAVRNVPAMGDVIAPPAFFRHRTRG